ncbi:MAG: glycosyltransferase [Pseudomonadota bacterium]
MDIAPIPFQSKKILFVIDSLCGGGAEAVVIRLAEVLVSQGFDVRIIIFANIIEYEIDPRVVITVFDRDQHKTKWMTYAALGKQVKKYIAEQGPFNLIIANLLFTHRVMMATKLPDVHYCIHTSYHTVHFAHLTGLKKWWKIKKFKSRFNDKNLIFVSKGAQDEVVKKIGVIPKSTRVIYNPFPIHQLKEKSLEPIDISEPYFLHVGRFQKQKRHDVLLKLFKKSNVKDKLVLIGTGIDEKKQAIEDLAHQLGIYNQLVFLGFQENPQKYMRNAIALLLSSECEGFSNVIVESLICETPVIALKCPSGPEEILSGELKQYLFEMNDHAGFAAKVYEVSQRPRKISSQIARVERFDENVVVPMYASLCK